MSTEIRKKVVLTPNGFVKKINSNNYIINYTKTKNFLSNIQK